jgi:hypothetical protein
MRSWTVALASGLESPEWDINLICRAPIIEAEAEVGIVALLIDSHVTGNDAMVKFGIAVSLVYGDVGELDCIH